jgi:hypothetical protein
MKRVILTDIRDGSVHTLEIPPTSPWHELLPELQEAWCGAREQRAEIPNPSITRS